MSNTRSLEICSKYRNRSQFPNPAEFEVELTGEAFCKNAKNSITALDGVSGAYPFYAWHGLPLTQKHLGMGITVCRFAQVWPPIQAGTPGPTTLWGTFVGGTKLKPQLGLVIVQAPLGVNTLQSDSVFQSGANVTSGTPNIMTISGTDDYFAGAMLARLGKTTHTLPTTPLNPILETSRIISFDGKTGVCTLESPFDFLDIAVDRYVIIFDQNITISQNITTPAAPNSTPFYPGGVDTPGAATYNPNPTLFINGGKNVDNWYVGCYVEDIFLTQTNAGTTYATPLVTAVTPITSKIIKYDGLTRIATLETQLTGWTPCADETTVGNETDNYVIRKSQPIVRGCVSSDAQSGGIGVAAGGALPALPGPGISINGCVYDFEFIRDINNLIICGSGYTTGDGLATTGGPGGLTVNISGGGPLNKNNLTIADPGLSTGGFQLGDIITITGGTPTTLAQIRVTGTGYGISLTNSQSLLSTQTNIYKGEYFYIPSRYPTNAIAGVANNGNVYPGSSPIGYGGTDTTDYGPDWPNNPSSVSTDFTTGGANDPTAQAQLIRPYAYGDLGAATRRWETELPPTVNNTGNSIPETGVRKIMGSFSDSSLAAVGSLSVRSVVINNSYPLPTGYTSLFNCTYFEILPFDRDNYCGLSYSGSVVSQQQMSCYEIGLTNLILPNQTLEFAPGGTIAFYSYLYVEIQNITSPSSGNRNIIYSNDPHSSKAIFRVAITDVPQKQISQFIKIYTSAKQTIKFKPNDNLSFKIYFEDGRTFQTKETDNSPPLDPNKLLQISAEFSIRRL